jgi:hypothetical protein
MPTGVGIPVIELRGGGGPGEEKYISVNPKTMLWSNIAHSTTINLIDGG